MIHFNSWSQSTSIWWQGIFLHTPPFLISMLWMQRLILLKIDVSMYVHDMMIFDALHVYVYVCICIYKYTFYCILYIFDRSFPFFPFSVRQKYSGKVFKIIYYNFSTLSPLSLGVYVFAGLDASAGSSQFQYICCVCVKDCSCIMYIYCGKYISSHWIVWGYHFGFYYVKLTKWRRKRWNEKLYRLHVWRSAMSSLVSVKYSQGQV